MKAYRVIVTLLEDDRALGSFMLPVDLDYPYASGLDVAHDLAKRLESLGGCLHVHAEPLNDSLMFCPDCQEQFLAVDALEERGDV